MKRLNDQTLEVLKLMASNTVNCIPPDKIIGPEEDPYLHRWFIKKSDEGNIYLHRFHRSDDDRALHDHPWAFRTIILTDGYYEHLPHGFRARRNAGEVYDRPALFRHMVEITPGEHPITLVITGKKFREWGFWCPNGFVNYKDFTKPGKNNDSQHVGRGCGE